MAAASSSSRKRPRPEPVADGEAVPPWPTNSAACGTETPFTGARGVTVCSPFSVSEGVDSSQTWISLKNATILDTTADPMQLRPGCNVLIRDGIILHVGDSMPHVKCTTTFDLGGKVLMPGLCDAHVHVTAATADFPALTRWPTSYATVRATEVLGDMLMRGFTTVRDAGGADHGLAQAVAEGRVAGPRLLFCGHALSQTGGHGDMRGAGEEQHATGLCAHGLGVVCDGVPEMQRACRQEIRKGATHIKLMVSGGVSSPTDRIDSTQFGLTEIEAAVAEARAANIYVMAHAYTPRAINRALECGAKSIEHGNLLDDSSLELFKRKGAFLVPTLSTYSALQEEGMEYGLPEASHDKVSEVLDAGINALRRAHEERVKLVYGTDLLGGMQRHQLQEFWIRRQVQSNSDVIRSATKTAAELFGLEGKIGVVAEGAFADLLVVDGNPLEDLSCLAGPANLVRTGLATLGTDSNNCKGTQQLVFIMKNGIVVKSLIGQGTIRADLATHAVKRSQPNLYYDCND